MIKILLVCMANVCRSPMAAAVLRHQVRDAGLAPNFEISAAGTHAQPGGKRPDARALCVLADRQYRGEKSRSRQVTARDFERYDLVLAMDASNLEALTHQCPPKHRHKLRLFLSFSPELDEHEVPDPYFGNQAGFERVLDLCEAGARGVINQLLYTP